MCQERGSPCNLLAWSAREFFRLVVVDGSCVGIQLDIIRIRKDLPVCANEDASCIGYDVDVGDLLSGLSFARGGGVETCFYGSVWVASIA